MQLSHLCLGEIPTSEQIQLRIFPDGRKLALVRSDRYKIGAHNV